MDRTRLIEVLKSALAGQHGVMAGWLFGSRARDEARPSSDVDVGVLLDHPPAPGFAGLPLDLEARLESEVGLPVQVVALNRAPADLVHRVLRDGVLLCDRAPAARIEFEVRRRAEYLDLLPVLEQYRRSA